MSRRISPIRLTLLLLLGLYLYIYPWSILLVAFDRVPDWGIWMGGALLILQGSLMGLWLLLNYRTRGLLAVLAILLLSWLVEHIGVTTGFPFGGYHYTDSLDLKIFGVVPLAVPFAWLLVVTASVGITDHLLRRERRADHTRALLREQAGLPATPRTARVGLATWISQRSRQLLTDDNPAETSALPSTPLPLLVRVLGAASFALLLDLMIEPVAVHINSYWVWDNTGAGYYGVPGSNFAAWWITGLLLAAILLLLIQYGPRSASELARTPQQGRLLYPWMPPLFYMLSLMMFTLVNLAHGKGLAVAIGGLVLCHLAFTWMQPWLVRWVMGDQATAVAAPDQTGG